MINQELRWLLLAKPKFFCLPSLQGQAWINGSQDSQFSRKISIKINIFKSVITMKIMLLKSGCSCRFYSLIITYIKGTYRYIVYFEVCYENLGISKCVTINFKHHFMFPYKVHFGCQKCKYYTYVYNIFLTGLYYFLLFIM